MCVKMRRSSVSGVKQGPSGCETTADFVKRRLSSVSGVKQGFSGGETTADS